MKAVLLSTILSQKICLICKCVALLLYEPIYKGNDNVQWYACFLPLPAKLNLKTSICIVDARDFNLCIFNLYVTTECPIATLATLFIHGLPQIWCINLDMVNFRTNVYIAIRLLEIHISQ